MRHKKRIKWNLSSISHRKYASLLLLIVEQRHTRAINVFVYMNKLNNNCEHIILRPAVYNYRRDNNIVMILHNILQCTRTTLQRLYLAISYPWLITKFE